ncbi:glycosyltransferase family 2 protein [Thiohalobacter sp. IOR34]|uniref:glycosyltransferase family 2 protein n=1 Tax=Thiohalobacter sp. IOR34 TaxID=3057176 RepID=UPI0025AFF315|nr:glycosyltransferase family 2 protein [Thiohalobacter sp. IOR34]WJW75888.1 glycosyltransferase family 2 protein [Thiohalobacter sp. IOR34]
MDLSVVIPVYNEQDNIQPLVDEIRAALEGVLDYEVVYVDDGSTDATLERLRAARAGLPRLRILRHAESCGQSTAVRSGVKAARAPWIATLDGDGQNDPADIPRLYRAATAEDAPPDLWLIAGWRRRRQDSPLKKFSSRVANAVRSRLLHDDTPDTGCGLKLFRRDGFLELPYFDHMHRFLPALVLRAGGQVRSVEVNHRPRQRGVSKYGLHNRLWVGIVDLFGVIWLQRRARRPQLSEVD